MSSTGNIPSYTTEKADVPLLPTQSETLARPATAKSSRFRRFIIAAAYVVAAAQVIKLVGGPLMHSLHHHHAHGGHHSDANAEALCPQASVLVPSSKNADLWEAFGETIGTDEFKLRAVDWLAGAVKIPTESYDMMEGPGLDPRWEVFGLFHDYLLGAFPLVHSTLKLTKVNTYALLYEWTGSDASLKPVLLAAHQDVVPVDPTTVDEWTHPPYSGHFDGQRIWGRGSSDDKSGLISILSTVESLLERGFKPTRSFVLAFGFDEEASGLQGAAALAKAILPLYGEDAFAMIVDEGGGFSEQFGKVFAAPGIAEKGYLDVRVEVHTPGGHSSVPPVHTSIGILSALLVEYESNPYKVEITRKSPVYGTLQCYAAHAPLLPPTLRQTIKRSTHSKKALKKLGKVLIEDKGWKALLGTTQAVDVITGGVKSNALPEQAWAIVNHRIETESSTEEVKAHDTALLKSLAERFNLTYNAFGSDISQSHSHSQSQSASAGTLTLTDAWGTALEPAPVTPIGAGDDARPWQLLSGTIKGTYNAHRGLGLGKGKGGGDGGSIAVTPGMPTGNTDTRYYWKLSRHIFRYNHSNGRSSSGIPSGVHTVNESLDVNALLEIIRFFSTLILNADEATVL